MVYFIKNFNLDPYLGIIIFKTKSTHGKPLCSADLGTLFLCCVRVVNQNTRSLLLLVFCYSYAK